MKNFYIIALNETGTKALEQHIAESMKEPRRNKLMFKLMGYTQKVINLDPYTIEIEINNKRLAQFLEPRDFARKVVETMTKNGAKEEIDYIIKFN